VSALGIVGDVHKNRKYHGGPDRALLLIASEAIDSLARDGWPVFYGALGENMTTVGCDYKAWRPGLRFRAGETLIELTKPRTPCATLDVYGAGIQRRIFDRRVKALDVSSPRWGESGFFAAVLEPGWIEKNDIIEVSD
jgi:MOSC domain-containing protein YiiM